MPLSVVVINAACNCDDVRVNEYEDLDMIFSAPCFLPLARSALAITSRFILFYFILQWAFCTTDRVDYRTYGTTSLPITTPLARTFTVRRNEKLSLRHSKIATKGVRFVVNSLIFTCKQTCYLFVTTHRITMETGERDMFEDERKPAALPQHELPEETDQERQEFGIPVSSTWTNWKANYTRIFYCIFSSRPEG
jgi:hypothetical protein